MLSLSTYQILEIIATISNILYLVFMIREKIITWIFGIIGSSIICYITYSKQVYFHAVLNLYYILVPIYGFLIWNKKDSSNKPLLKIGEITLKSHIIISFLAIVVSLVLSCLATKLLGAQFATLDALIFSFAAVATILQARKVLSNWIYWIVINALTLVLYFNIETYILTGLMVAYIIIPIIGYIKWKKQL